MKIISLMPGLFLSFFICASNDTQLIEYDHDQNWSNVTNTNVWTTTQFNTWGPIWWYDWQEKPVLNQSNNISTVNVDFHGSPIKQITITNDTQFLYTNYIDGSVVGLILINTSSNEVKLDWGDVLYATKAVTSLPSGKFLNAYINCHDTKLYVSYETWVNENDDVYNEGTERGWKESGDSTIDWEYAPIIIDTNGMFFTWDFDESSVEITIQNNTDRNISLIISPSSKNPSTYWTQPVSSWDIIVEKNGWLILVLCSVVFICLLIVFENVVIRITKSINIWKRGWPPTHCDANGDLKDYDEDD